MHLFIHSPTDEKIRLFVFCSDYKQCCYGHSSPYLLVHVCECESFCRCTPRIGAALLQWMLSSSAASYCQQMSHHVPSPHSHVCYGQICSFSPKFNGPVEKAMAPHFSTLAWKIPWMEEPGRLGDFTFTFTFIGGGHGNPLQCSCLENSRDGGAWWAAVYGVAQSRT